MYPENNIATLFTLRAISKEILKLTGNTSQRARFTSQHEDAFDTINKIKNMYQCDCFPPRDVIEKYHNKLRDFLNEITEHMTQIETDWNQQKQSHKSENTKDICDILDYLRSLKINCNIDWNKYSTEPAIRTIAFFRKGNALQQINEIINPDSKKEMVLKKKDEKEFEELSYWQSGVLKYLN